MYSSIKRLSKKAVVLSILLVTLVVIVYSLTTEAHLFVEEVDPLIIVLALSVYLLSWLISALRLKYLHRILDGGKTLPIKDYFYARLLGGLMAYLTPSAIGGEPARAFYLSARLNDSFSKYFALTIYEVFYDILVVNVLAIGFSIYKYPFSIPVLLVGLANIAFWIITYYTLNNIIKPDRANPAIRKILYWVEKYVVSKIESISNGYYTFGSAFSTVSRKTGLVEKINVLILTITLHLTSAFTIAVIAFSVEGSTPIQVLVSSFIAYLYALTLGALPTPGGAVAIEYGLSLTLTPSVVVLSRTLMYYSVIVLGFLVLIRSNVVKELIK